MVKKHRLGWFLLLSFVWLVGLGAPAAKKASLEDKAALRLMSYLEKTLPSRGLSTSCIDLLLEKSSPYFEYAVRERHGGKCPGDPETAPIVDRYRVPRRSGAMQLYDPIEDRWNPIKGN